MREVIADIVKHTGGLGFIEEVKITGTAEETKIETMDPNKTVFIKGSLHNALSEFVGEFGIANLALLNGLLGFANFRSETASFSVTRGTRNGVEVPEEFVFDDGNDGHAVHRLMSADMVPDQAIIANIPWDVVFEPSRSKIQEFSQLASLYNGVERYFSVKTDTKDNLVFNIGDQNAASNRVSMVFERAVSGAIKGDWNWPSQQVLGILKVLGNEPLTMSFTDKGALQIGAKSDYGSYNYILPGRRR